MENIVVYEDALESSFYPIDQLRAVFEIKVGVFSFLERIFFLYPKCRYHLFYRNYLKPLLKQRYSDFFHNTLNVGLDVLFINGRVFFNKDLKDLIDSYKEEDFLIMNKGKVLCFRLKGSSIESFLQKAIDINFDDKFIINFFRASQESKILEFSAMRFENIWKIIQNNGSSIIYDLNLIDKSGLVLSKIHPHAVLTNEKEIYIGKNCKISPFVHIDASNGPVYIGSGVEIKSHVLIEGPVFIDNKTKIFPGYIRKNTTVSENCRIGGEIEGSIILSNTNKYHAGFLGHSYVGEWVNLGALTSTSDLKNNYKEIYLDLGRGRKVNTENIFLGSIIGDHSKFGIGSMLNTGTIIGTGVNLVSANYKSSKYIGSFSWIIDSLKTLYLIDEFIETVRVVKQRRGEILSKEEEEIIRYLHSIARDKKNK
jgi:UDP-N-acetylglucosamine diphosphorylase / glucose-1-phosphate thymidylyltransferase / UDP-N-acetylgalactosamine diphosphorylase / glucosamine-1-phosphate N-acetyltransferase / galactosamine-1-phosphate N-acetyltransferase